MKGSKIAPWISIFAGLLWLYAAVTTDERRTLSIILCVVFLLLGAAQLRINRARFTEEKNPSADKEAG
ncbi:MAG TPA: hypothetical protein VGC89_10200 [Pyrinomonadaceae bacterium]